MNLLKEYTAAKDVAEGLPWGGITMPFVMRQKDGSCFSVIEYQPYEKTRLSKSLHTPDFCRGWSLWSECQHTPDSDRYFLTICWNPFISRHNPHIENTLGVEVEQGNFLPCFAQEAQGILREIQSVTTARLLEYQDLMDFLSFTLSMGENRVLMPEVPLYMDALLSQDIEFDFLANDILAVPARRVMGGKRYRVDVCREELLEAGYEGVQPLFASDSFDEALAFAKEKMPKLKDTIEEYIADERREKILAYDNRNIRNVYDDFMAKSHAVAVDMSAEKPIYLHKDDCTIEVAAMMLLEKKYSKSNIFRALRDCSPLTTYPGEENSLAKQILETVERHGAEKYVTYKFRAHLSKQHEVAR